LIIYDREMLVKLDMLFISIKWATPVDFDKHVKNLTFSPRL